MRWFRAVLMQIMALFARSAGASSPVLAVGSMTKTSWTTGSTTFTSFKGADETHGTLSTSSGTTVTDFKYAKSSSSGGINATQFAFTGGAGTATSIRATITGGSSWATFARTGTPGAYYYEVSGDPLNLTALTNGQTVSFSVESV